MMEQFLKLAPAQKAGVLVAVLAVLGAGGYFLLIDPVVTEASQSDKTLKSTEAEISGLKATAREDELTKLRKHKDDLVEADKENRKMLPSTAEVPDLIETLQRDAVAAGLVVSRFERLETRHQNLVDAIPVRITLTGSLIDIIRYLRVTASPERRVIHLRGLSVENQPLEPDGLLKELHAALTPEQRAARGALTPDEQRLERIEVQELARKKSIVRVTFTAYAFTWTGKPPPEEAAPEPGGKRKRT